jgi:hypothetical protein
VAEYSRRVVTTTEVQYYLPKPTNWAEVGKVYAAIKQEMGEERSKWDDAVVIDADDEEITFTLQGTREVKHD